MLDEKATLFFYGSLKRGYSNHRLIADQEYLGEAATEAGYRIIEIGQYGGMIRDEISPLRIKGELWAVDAKCLAKLDEFESAEGSWVRLPVAVPGWTGVQSYCWTGDVPAQVRSNDCWPF
jgi:gamma-glutamylcyclotransferase (GGCT)/AIG2-like uncharacterized protein YtfP